MQIGDYIKVFDKKANILLSGQIKIITDNPKGYSVDGIFFVNPNSKKINIIKEERPTDQIYNAECESNAYILYKHNNIDNTFDYDFFMWTEIEPEVKEVCDLLNQIPGIETYSSCCGHGKIPPYVDFIVKDVDNFYNLLDFLRDNNLPSRTDKHGEIESSHRFVIGVEGRGTCHLESLKLNDDFKDLCRMLKKYVRL